MAQIITAHLNHPLWTRLTNRSCRNMAHRPFYFPTTFDICPRSLSTSISLFQNAVKETLPSFSHTLQLPKTLFSMRPDSTKHQSLLKLTTRDLYAWQSKQQNRPPFTLHDGPPYANGNLHIGHAMNKILKDINNRFALLKGHRINYVPGWDCHGLPIELKALKQSPEIDVCPLSVRDRARNLALSTIITQKADFESWAVMGDWNNAYRTLDKQYIIRQLKVFRDMTAKGLIYRQCKPVFYSPATRTALAEAELEYTKHESQSIYFTLAIDVNSASRLNLPSSLFLLVWTTTPWTLPANQAVTVNENLEYIIVRLPDSSDHWILAASRLETLKSSRIIPDDSEIYRTLMGSDLISLTYSPLYRVGGCHSLFPVLAADYVTSDAGSGIVHTAPGHGMDDYFTGLKHNLSMLSPVDECGCYDDQAPKHLRGLPVLTTGNVQVIDDMRRRGRLVNCSPLIHKYPYDWRSKTPVITCSKPQWFARIGAIREQALAALENVVMVPESGRNRLTRFIVERNEWCLSRQRAWGVPIPALFHRESGQVLMTPHSIDHIIKVFESANVNIDAWWSLDEQLFVPPSVPSAERMFWIKGKDTMDVWFDSGTSWTILDGEEAVADIYLEGSDQHRGWFQSSLLTSVANRGIAPFKKVITHGFVVDESRQKMSKSQGNVVSPSNIVNGGKDKKLNPPCGVDGLRMWVGMSECSKDVSLGSTVQQATADLCRKIRNTCRFLLGNLHDYEVPASQEVTPQLNCLDKYILHQVSEITKACADAYCEHQFVRIAHLLAVFTNVHLSTVYFEAIKDRLYVESKCSPTRIAAQYTLNQVLTFYLQIFAPILPLLAEEVYMSMKKKNESVVNVMSYFADHKWRDAPEKWKNDHLAQDIERCLVIRSIINQALTSLRSQNVIRSNLEANVFVHSDSPKGREFITRHCLTLQSLSVVSAVTVGRPTDENSAVTCVVERPSDNILDFSISVYARHAVLHKCPRCWNYWSEKKGQICHRCTMVLE